MQAGEFRLPAENPDVSSVWLRDSRRERPRNSRNGCPGPGRGRSRRAGGFAFSPAFWPLFLRASGLPLIIRSPLNWGKRAFDSGGAAHGALGPQMTPRRVQILEIGASQLACGGFTAKAGRLVLEHWVSESIHPEWTMNLERFEQMLPQLAAFAARQPRRASTLLLPGHLVLTKIVSVAPRVPGGRLVLDPEEHIPLALSDVVWGWQELDGDAATPSALLAMARKVHVERIGEVIAGAGLAIDRIVPAAAALLPPAGAGPAALASSDVRSTLLAATSGARRFVRTIPAGTGQLEQTPDRLRVEIARTLKHWTATLGLPAAGVLQVCGIELTEAFRTALPWRVERYDAGADIDTPGGVVPKSLRPEMVGAARGSLQHSRSPIDLSPDSLIRERGIRKRSRLRFATAALVVAGLVPPLLFHRMHAAESARRAQAVERDLQAVTSLQSANAAQLRELEQIRARVRALSPAYAARDSWRRFLSALQDCLGEAGDAWLERLQIPATRSANGEGRRLVLAGRIPAVDPAAAPQRAKQLLRSLAAVTFVAGVEGVRFENAGDGALKFAATLVLTPDSRL